MKQLKVRISENKKLHGAYFKLSFDAPFIAREVKPGQFLEIRISDGPEPFLRKPLGIHSVKGKLIGVLYEIVGKGTQILGKKKPGQVLDIIGPLGNGFEYSLPVRRFASSPVLVAGGIGVAPLVFLAEKLRNRKAVVFIGAKTKKDILCEKEFRKLGYEVKIATDDGSKGYKGFVTDLLRSLLANRQTGKPATIYACGPKVMMKEAARTAARHKIPCQVLLEEYMACGVGVCLGCAVKTKSGYKMVCKDGPVFDSKEVIWE